MNQDEGKSKRVTLQTIADRMGVSRTTVSNAYNKPGELASELRDRILGVAEELGYTGPDAAARMLRTGRMGAIGVLFTEDLRYVFKDPDTTSLLQGIAEVTARSGIGLMLLPATPGADSRETPVQLAPVDGHIIFSVSDQGAAIDAVLAQGHPVVVVDAPDLGERASFVGIDDYAGARLAASHLIELGHRNLAVMVGRFSSESTHGQISAKHERAATSRVTSDRISGYRAALSDAGRDPSELILWEAGGNEPDSARRAGMDLLVAHPDVTGLLCLSDQIAIGVCQAARRMGLEIPQDLSVVGFDDVPRARNWDPPLTTVRQPIVDKGRVAADLLLEQIGGAPPGRIMLPIDLVVRSSTSPAPS